MRKLCLAPVNGTGLFGSLFRCGVIARVVRGSQRTLVHEPQMVRRRAA